MESPSIEEENMIKDVHLFRLEKLKKATIVTTINGTRNLFIPEKENEEIKDRILTDIRNLFRLEKENKVMKDIILRDIRNLFENEEENYYKPERLRNFWSDNYIEYKKRGDRNKILSVEKYINKIKPYLKDIIDNHKKSGMWKFQLTIAINFTSSTDNDEQRVMHSKSDNIEIMINNEADEVIK